jgi:predicted DCC family thiol-disulfide oxidoreductase YuxK
LTFDAPSIYLLPVSSTLVAYDPDCGVCTHAVRVLRRLDRGGRLDLRPLILAADVPGAPALSALAQSLHVRDADGRWLRNGSAAIRVAAAIPMFRPLALLAGLPPFRAIVDAAYLLVARNRRATSSRLGMRGCPVPGSTAGDR